MKTKEEVSDKVNELIEKNMDAYKGFKKASENTENIHLRDYLMDQATDRKTFADELLVKLKSYNPEWDVDAQGSAAATLHRTWINLKSILTGSSDKSILEECMRGDRASVEEYEEFLKNYSSVSPEINSLIQKQLENIVDSLDNQFRLEELS